MYGFQININNLIKYLKNNTYNNTYVGLQINKIEKLISTQLTTLNINLFIIIVKIII